MFKLKKPIKHIPGQIKEALVREVSAVDYPANGIPFIYVKSQEDKMDEELRKALMQMGLIPQAVEKADEKPEGELAPDVLDTITKAADAFQSVQDLIEADTEGTVDDELAKAGVKKEIQRPAMLQLLASLHGKIGEYLDKAGYDKKKQKMAKASDGAEGDQPEAQTEPVAKGKEMTEEEIQALVAKSVAEALQKQAEPQTEGQADDAAAAGDDQSDEQIAGFEKAMSELTGRVSVLAEALDGANAENEELKKQHETEKAAWADKLETLTASIETLEKKFSVRAPNSALVNPGPAPEQEATVSPIKKQQDKWAGTPVAEFASEVRKKA